MGGSALDILSSQNISEDAIEVGSPNALDKFYEKLAQTYNLDELKDILECEDNMLIDSGAGSGKTTTLLLKILRDILQGKLTYKQQDRFGNEYICIKPVLVCTFLKSGASDISEKFVKMIQDFDIRGISVNNIVFRTIHSEVYSALKAMGVDLNIVTDVSKYLRQACNDYNIKSLMSKSKVLTVDELNDILSIVTYARNRLDNTRYKHSLMQEYSMTEIDLKGILANFRDYKRVDGVKDFEDMEEMLLEGMQVNQNVFSFCASRYRYIYIDEFQDTSQLQYALMTPYLKGAEGFIAIGDEDQAIYSFRGSDVSLIQKKFEEDYKPVLKHLTVNRRCRENILHPILSSIEMNEQRHKKDLSAAKPNGEVEIVIDDSINYLSKSVKQSLQKGRAAVLGRTNADLLIPTMLLLSSNYNITVSKSVSLSDRIPKQVLGIMQLITERYNMNFDIYFKMFLTRQNLRESDNLCHILETSPEKSIYNIPLEDIQYSAPNLFPLINLLRIEVPKDPVNAYLEVLTMLEEDVFNGKTIYAQRARDFVYYIKKLIKEHEYYKGKNIDELSHIFFKVLPKIIEDRKLDETKKSNKSDSVEEEITKDTAQIRVSTVHDAKGKEWETVYIWNDVYGSFPNSVGTRSLTKEEFEEERRVHYIAWTRAMDKLVVFTRSDIDMGFLQECDLASDGVKIIDKNNTNMSSVLEEHSETQNKMQNKGGRKVSQTKIQINANTEKVDWHSYLDKFVIKYLSPEFLFTREGRILDMSLTKLGGVDGIRNYLENQGLTDYPTDMIEEVIADTLESYLENA